jgi:hypothetical protein
MEELNGATDPAAYILSANINRRNLTSGQRAICHAMVHPEPTKRGGKQDRGKKQSFAEKDCSNSQLSKARIVLKASTELAAQVRDGTISLDKAYEEVQRQKKATELAERGLEFLRENAPDLVDLVPDLRFNFYRRSIAH